MKRILLTGLAILAAGALRAEDITNLPPHRLSTLTDAQKAELAQKADEVWSQLPPEAKIRLLRLHKALTDLPPEERHFIHERIEKYLTLSPDDRERIKKNNERWHAMSPEERERAREQFKQWRKDHPNEVPPPLPASTNSQQSATQTKPQETR